MAASDINSDATIQASFSGSDIYGADFSSAAVQCPPRCLRPTSFDSQSSTHKVEVMEGWQNYREWVQKNEHKKIKSVFITFEIYTIFSSNLPF
jgi:hypothetical protein